MTSVRVKTLQKHIVLRDVANNCIEFKWDYNNESTDKWCRREFEASLSDLSKRNLMWVFDLKKKANWKRGEFLYCFMTSNCDGNYYIHFNKDKKEIGFYDLIICPCGYASMRVYNHYTLIKDEDEDIRRSFFIRLDSVYNDKICEINRLIEKN